MFVHRETFKRLCCEASSPEREKKKKSSKGDESVDYTCVKQEENVHYGLNCTVSHRAKRR